VTQSKSLQAPSFARVFNQSIQLIVRHSLFS
jgi:hypothetical protein